MTILINDLEKHFVGSLIKLLHENNYHAEAVYDEDECLKAAQSGMYDMLIVGTDSSNTNRIGFVKRIRESGCRIPVILLTSGDSPMDRVFGLEYGSDYALTKQFNSFELLACIKALQRRQGMIDDTLSCGNTRLDLTSCILSAPQGSVKLSSKEFMLMKLFLTIKGENLPKESIIEKIWGGDINATDNYVEVYTSMLRRKLSSIGSNILIRAVLRQGYHLEIAS